MIVVRTYREDKTGETNTRDRVGEAWDQVVSHASPTKHLILTDSEEFLQARNFCERLHIEILFQGNTPKWKSVNKSFLFVVKVAPCH